MIYFAFLYNHNESNCDNLTRLQHVFSVYLSGKTSKSLNIIATQPENYHLRYPTETFVKVLLPLAIPHSITYYVPESLVKEVRFGQRVEVPFGRNKLYSAVVVEIVSEKPADVKVKPIISLIDKEPIITPEQVKLWQWIAQYYCCTEGEVLQAALPANLKLSSETILILSPLFDDDYTDLTDKEYMITEALTLQNEISIGDIRKILDQKTVYPIVNSLIEKRIVYLKAEMKEKYKPKKIACVRFAQKYVKHPEQLSEAFDLCAKSSRQTEALMGYIVLAKDQDYVQKTDLYKKASVDSTVLKAMEKKGIFELYEREISRLGTYEDDLQEMFVLDEQQTRALSELTNLFKEKSTVLLHGVTGSGKTRVYIEFIQAAIARGEQVLYLLPEVALTAQIISRLQKVFGDEIATYHHKLNDHERVEVWNAVKNGKSVVLGPRSAMFLPYQNLKWVIVDEEHDSSYKQHDPAPRYHGRDTAIYMAHLYGAKTLLGTATPSVETYYNAKKGKYGLVQMPRRYGDIAMPEINVTDAKKEKEQRKLQSHFTSKLLDDMTAALERGEQIILFQNRRGYAPALRCQSCGWTQECKNCDVTLTYHKFHHNLQCHYCGYHAPLVKNCPNCGDIDLRLQGFGTEKIEDELKIYLPDAKIARMDYDSVRSKNAHAKLINDFEEKRVDVLVGTQMVTKGLDFENVSLVGIISADQLLQFPDFRASERGFQLMTQVSGRAGRKKKQGQVLIQAMNVAHPVLREVIENDYQGFYHREIMERNAFKYPPFTRLIKITLKHKKADVLNHGAKIFGEYLKKELGDRVQGPAVPHVGRVRNYYLLDFSIKLELNMEVINFAKRVIRASTVKLNREAGYSTVRVNTDVDPV